jgi:hypothetical protein
MRYMYTLYYFTIDGIYKRGITSTLAALRKWRKSPEAQSASDIEFRRIPLTHYNEARKARAGEFGGWDFPTLRLSSEPFELGEFDPKLLRQVSPSGEQYTLAGRCKVCRSTVFAVIDGEGHLEEPDPRGFAGPRHSLYTFEDLPGVQFCWDCPNEHGEAGYTRCRVLAGEVTR